MEIGDFLVDTELVDSQDEEDGGFEVVDGSGECLSVPEAGERVLYWRSGDGKDGVSFEFRRNCLGVWQHPIDCEIDARTEGLYYKEGFTVGKGGCNGLRWWDGVVDGELGSDFWGFEGDVLDLHDRYGGMIEEAENMVGCEPSEQGGRKSYVGYSAVELRRANSANGFSNGGSCSDRQWSSKMMSRRRRAARKMREMREMF